MKTRTLDDLHYKLCDELDEIAQKKELGAGDLDIIHKLTDTIKNIEKIKMYKRADEFSQRDGGNSYRGNSYDGGDKMMMDDRYDDRHSGARRGEHYVRGHYSRGSDSEHIAHELREMMDRADDNEIRNALKRAINAIEG